MKCNLDKRPTPPSTKTVANRQRNFFCKITPDVYENQRRNFVIASTTDDSPLFFPSFVGRCAHTFKQRDAAHGVLRRT